MEHLFSRTRRIFIYMKMIVVGSGWLGKEVAESLAASHSVIATARTRVGLLQNVLSIAYQPGEALPPADIIIICFPPDRSSPAQYTEDCLQIVHTQDSRAKFLLCSSTSVIRSPEDAEKPVENDSPIAQAEKTLSGVLQNRLTILRFGGLIGPGRLPVKRLLESGKTLPGNDIANVIHREDAAEAIRFVIDRQLWGRIFSAVAPHHSTKKQLYTAMSAANGLSVPMFNREPSGNFAIQPSGLLEAGFSFRYASPLSFPEVQRMA